MFKIVFGFIYCKLAWYTGHLQLRPIRQNIFIHSSVHGLGLTKDRPTVFSAIWISPHRLDLNTQTIAVSNPCVCCKFKSTVVKAKYS